MNKNFPKVTCSEARHFAKIAEKMPLEDVKFLQSVLRLRMLQAGYESDHVLGIVDGMTERFLDEDKEVRRQLIAESLRQEGILGGQEKIEATDEQIVTGIKKTLPYFKSNRDWGGVYIILVSCCDYPSVKTDFVLRFWQMGIYAVDNPKCVGELTKDVPPAIYQDEYCDHPFSYQALQKGYSTTWPMKYEDCINIDLGNRDFAERKEIAGRFRRNLLVAGARIIRR